MILTTRVPFRHVGRMGRSVGPWMEEAVVVIGIQVVRLHQPHQVHRIDRSRKSAVGLIDVIAHRLCAGDALFADRHRGVAMILTGNPVWHWGTIRSFACRLLSRQRPEHRVDGRVHALEIGRTIGLKDLIEADRVRQPRSWLRHDDREAERLEYFPATGSRNASSRRGLSPRSQETCSGKSPPAR